MSDSVIGVQIALPPAVFAGLAVPFQQRIRSAVVEEMRSLMNSLGIPGEIDVQLRPEKGGNDDSQGPWMSVFVDGSRCGHSAEFIEELLTYTLGKAPEWFSLGMPAADWMAELHRLNSEALAQFLTIACPEIVKLHRSKLLGRVQAQAYLSRLGVPHNPALEGALRESIHLGISISDTVRVLDAIKACEKADPAFDGLAEQLLAASSADAIEIRLAPGYLRDITLEGGKETLGCFATMRDGLYYELGVRFPDFRFVEDKQLKPQSFAFRFHAMTTAPQLGLPPGNAFVSERPEELLARSFEILESRRNPATGSPCSVVALNRKSDAESLGFSAWNAFEFLVLRLSSNLRSASASFVNEKTVGDAFEQLASLSPALVEAVSGRFTLTQRTRMLRDLVGEGVSIRNLRLILERLLDYDYVVAEDVYTSILIDDRLPLDKEPDAALLRDPMNLATFVRAGLKEQISHQLTRGQSSLSVFLLDPDQEQGFRRGGIDDAGQTSLRIATMYELNVLPVASAMPAVLTTIDVRPLAREMLADYFPRLPVVAYQELSLKVNIQPLARLSGK